MYIYDTACEISSENIAFWSANIQRYYDSAYIFTSLRILSRPADSSKCVKTRKKIQPY